MRWEHWAYTLPLRLRSLMRRRRVETELDEELRFHLACRMEAEIARGATPEQARRRALNDMEGVERTKEECRDARRVTWVEHIGQDLHYAARAVRKSPGLTAAIVVTMALCVGANTAMFSIVDGVLFRPLPFSDPERLLMVTGHSLRQQVSLVTLRDQGRSAEFAAYVGTSEFNLTGEGAPVRVPGSAVSANLFNLLGRGALVGRTFETGEDAPGRDQVVLLSHALWQSRFGGDASIVNRSIRVDDMVRRIAGVMPPDFQFPTAQAQLWVPLRIDPRNVGAYWWTNNLNIIGRLRPGASLQQARAEVRMFVPRIRDSFSWKLWPDWGSETEVVELREGLVGTLRTRLLVLLGAVGLVLLIGCVNVANLLLAQGAARRREMALRTALGADRPRILRQLLTESLLLSGAGAMAGLLLAALLGHAATRLLPDSLPRVTEAAMDGRVLGFTAGLALLTGLGFGLLPAVRFSKAEPQGALRTGERSVAGSLGHQRVSSALVAFEVALGVVVVVSAGLLARSLVLLTNVAPGFDAGNTLTAMVTPNDSLCRTPARCLAFYEELLKRVRGLPGVTAAAAANALPLGGDVWGSGMELEDHPIPPGTPAASLLTSTITPEYLAAMRVPLREGRTFAQTDTAQTEPVAIVSASTAQRWWPGQSAVGKHVRFVADRRWMRVVGVAADVQQVSLAGDPPWVQGHLYYPYAQHLQARMAIVARTTGQPLGLAGPLQRTVAELQSDVPVSQIRTLDEVMTASLGTPRATLWMLGSFAVLALLLSGVGVYAVAAHTVAQRTREIGIRLALGARPAAVCQQVLRRSALLALSGLGVGIVAALASARVMRSLLFQIAPTDVATFTAVPVVLLIVLLLASYLPARRAARVDPVVALREE